MPEVEVELGEQGEVVGAHLASHDESHQIIEEFMLTANEAVAEFLTEEKSGISPPCAPCLVFDRLREFAEFVLKSWRDHRRSAVSV